MTSQEVDLHVCCCAVLHVQDGAREVDTLAIKLAACALCLQHLAASRKTCTVQSWCKQAKAPLRCSKALVVQAISEQSTRPNDQGTHSNLAGQCRRLTRQGSCHTTTSTRGLGSSLREGLCGGPLAFAVAGQGLVDGEGNSGGLCLGNACRAQPTAEWSDGVQIRSPKAKVLCRQFKQWMCQTPHYHAAAESVGSVSAHAATARTRLLLHES